MAGIVKQKRRPRSISRLQSDIACPLAPGGNAGTIPGVSPVYAQA